MRAHVAAAIGAPRLPARRQDRERGIPISYLGQTAYTPKLRLGGRLEEQFLFIKAYRPDVRLSLPLQKLVTRRFRREIVEKSAGRAE